ncbi:MAG: hypothetical protein QOJ93_1672 [Actinomycetota bacterium]|nr:hypothetical protein [Actinomycetota bacterium]
MKRRSGVEGRSARSHFLTIRWEGTAEDGTPVTLQATLCRAHRQVIALQSASARGVRRQFGESCDMCQGREPRTLGGEPPEGQ